MVDRRTLAIYAAIAVAIVTVIGAIVWFSHERLSGYNMEPVNEAVYKEPTGIYREFFTGTVTKIEQSIIGPKITVKRDTDVQERTLFLSKDGLIWLGLIIGEHSITGDAPASLNDLKKGQRVACFVGKGNKAEHIHILVR